MSESITDVEAAVRELGALPVPAGDDRAPWGRGEDGRPLLPMGAHWTDIPELVDQEVARIRGRVDQAQSGHWYVASDTETWRPPGTVRTNVDGYQRTVGRVTNMLAADLDLVLHAHDDLSWCLEMLAKFRARVAELEAERHVTNEALDDAVRELRARDEATAPYTATPEAHRQMRAALTKHYTHARGGNCENCGSAPEQWCPDCAACEQGCFGGFDGNNCTHSNAKWGGA